MKNEILKLKPTSIYDVIDESFFFEKDDPNHREYLTGGNYYEIYYAISKYFNPKSILEIGVRFGYSLFTMISASDFIERAVGYDIDEYEKDGLEKAKKEIETRLKPGVELSLELKDSQSISELDSFYDIIHIDGDHSYGGKVHDLNLTIGKSSVVIVDDYYHVPAVKKSVDEFIAINAKLIKETTLIDSIRGTFIIVYN